MSVGSLHNMLADQALDRGSPEVGDGATVVFWTDRHACTVVEVSPTGHRLVVQEDRAVRTDGGGMTDAQTYTFERDEGGRRYTATRRKNGDYRVRGTQMRVLLGSRSHYFDYSF